MATYSDKFRRIQERLNWELNEFNDMQHQDMNKYGETMMKSASNVAMEILKIANEDENRTEAEIIRTHQDTWAAVRMGDFMYLCGVFEVDGEKISECLIVNMDTERIVQRSEAIIKMVRDQQEDRELNEDVLMYEFARCEYI